MKRIIRFFWGGLEKDPFWHKGFGYIHTDNMACSPGWLVNIFIIANLRG
jgi:hypothetical protein